MEKVPPPPPLCISPLSHAQGLPSSILSNPVLFQKLSLLWVLGRVLWQGFLVQQRSTTTVPLSNLPTSCRHPFPTPGQAHGICRHTEFCKTDRTTWKLTYYARRQHETERSKNRGFWFFRCRVDVLHSEFSRSTISFAEFSVSTQYIFAAQVFYRSYVLRRTRLRSLEV